MTTSNTYLPSLIGVALLFAIFPIASPFATAETSGPSWPALDDAEIRPGVQVYSNGGQCTSNFVFEETETSALHLGLAAHCVDQVGQSAIIHGVDGNPVVTGTVAYTSWAHTSGHDFALILIPEEATGKVHPAALHYGGPTGLADTSQLVGGERFLFYGHSELRFGLHAINWHEGYVTIPGDEKGFGNALTPGIPGDSGSGMIDADGRAFGVLVTVGFSIAPTTGLMVGTNGYTNLDVALQFAESKTGMQFELQTWDLLDDGLLPDLPL